MKPPVLVTGANGFVGTHLVDSLAAEGWSVVGLLRRGRKPRATSEQSIEWRTLDEWTSDSLARALHGVGAVVHAASVVHRPGAAEREYAQFNRDGTAALLSACRAAGIARLVFLSTIKVYGEHPPGIIDEQTPVDPEAPYALSKIEAEQAVLQAAEADGTKATILRLCPVYGRGDKGNVRTMIRAIARRRFLLPGDGSNRKSIVHVSTVAEVVRAAIESPATGVFVVADREAPSMRQLADTIAVSLGRPRPLAIPASLLRGAARVIETTAGLVGATPKVTRALVDKSLIPTVCSPAKVESDLGVRCHVELRPSIDDEVAWMREDNLL